MSETNFLDFEIIVEKAGKSGYLVRARSGGGEAQVRFTNPFNEDKRALIDATLTKVALRASAGTKTRGSSAPEVKRMKEFGATLFNTAIRGPVRDFYNQCRGEADNTNMGIRWRLTLDPSVGGLPWEFMLVQDDFVALHPKTPVVRYIKGAERVVPLTVEHPLCLLVVIASPSDETPLETSTEKEQITQSLKPLIDQGLVQVTYIEGANTWDRLCKKLMRDDTHILHFIGHGAFDEVNGEGVLVMEDSDRKAIRIESKRLQVLAQGKSCLRLVVLNSCLGTEGTDSQPFSSMAAGFVRSGIPAVIAMQFEISDPAARAIAETFYTSLALNNPVDAALTDARRAIYLDNPDSLEWATPILYMQVPDGRLFHLPAKAPGEPPVTGPLPEPEAEPETVVARLVRQDNGQEFKLDRREIKIGRGGKNDINLDEGDVSRKHATLVRSGDTYEIENFSDRQTYLNGEPISRRTTLSADDVIRIGEISFKYQLPGDQKAETRKTVDKPAIAKRKSAQATVAPTDRESLEARAAAHYEAGNSFMARGSWAEAITAFTGARMCVPNYLDTADKISVCQERYKVASLYGQAQHFYRARNYDQALQALAEARKQDPKLVDSDDIQESSECGQKYLQAIAELQRGNKAGGVDLLREVISRRPNFEDAARRFDDLTRGGTGLLQPTPSAFGGGLLDKGKAFWSDMFGSTPPPPPGALVPTPPPPEPASTTGFAWRTYEVENPNLQQLADEVQQYLLRNGYEHQVMQQDDGWMVQGRTAKGWRELVGMGQAATVVIELADGGFKVSIGGAKWIDKGAGMATGFLTGGITWVTAVVGVMQQQQLVEELWRITETFAKTNGGRQVAFS